MHHGKPYKLKAQTGKYMMKKPVFLGVYKYYIEPWLETAHVIGEEDTVKATFMHSQGGYSNHRYMYVENW